MRCRRLRSPALRARVMPTLLRPEPGYWPRSEVNSSQHDGRRRLARVVGRARRTSGRRVRAHRRNHQRHRETFRCSLCPNASDLRHRRRRRVPPARYRLVPAMFGAPGMSGVRVGATGRLGHRNHRRPGVRAAIVSPRAKHVCPEPGCTRLIPQGTRRCEEHARQPWAGKEFDARRADTAAHRALKAQVFARAGYWCQIGDVGCLGGSGELEVDRIDNTLGYDDLSNLQSACSSCHAKKTGREGRAAQLGAPGPQAAAPTPVPPPRRPVRRRRRRGFDGVSVPRTIWTDPL